MYNNFEIVTYGDENIFSKNNGGIFWRSKITEPF